MTLSNCFALNVDPSQALPDGALATDVPFTAKPYRMKALAQKVEEVPGSCAAPSNSRVAAVD